MNARARHSPETRESATGSCRFAGGSSVAVGACLCGTVHYAVDRPLETLSHYSDPDLGAQRATEFPSFVSAPLVAFRWVAGEEWLTNYDPAEGTRRSFCRWCGSSMPVSTRDKAAMLLPLASLDMSGAADRQPLPMPA
jgi:hypothetical protein